MPTSKKNNPTAMDVLEAAVKGDLVRLREIQAAAGSCQKIWDASKDEIEDALGYEPLHGAAHAGNLEAFRFLVEEGGFLGLLEAHAECVGTPLQAACSKDHFEIARYLVVDQKADANADWNDKTPLQHAAANGNLELVKVLVQDGGAEVDKKDPPNGSALTQAAMNGHLEVVQLLLKRTWNVRGSEC